MASYTEYIVKITSWNDDPDSGSFGESYDSEKTFTSGGMARSHADFMSHAFNEAVRNGKKLHYTIQITTVEYSTEDYATGGN